MILLLTFLLTCLLQHQVLSFPFESLQNASCTDCGENADDIFNTNMTTFPGLDDDMPFLIKFCLYLNISLDQCTCNDTPGLCKVKKDFETFRQEARQPTYIRSNRYTVIYTTVAIIASVFGLTGNALVLWISMLQRKELSSCKLHIAELGFVNFVFSVVQMINSLPLYWTNKWIYGFTTCKVIRCLMETGSLLTICFILTIAIERYILIVHPLDSKIVEGKVKHISIAVISMIVMATIVPYTIGLDIEKNTGRCVIFQNNTGYMALPYNWFVVGFYSILPVFIISIAYGKIIRSLSKTTSKTEFNNGLIIMKRMKTNHRIVRVTISILGIFIVCTLPPRLIYICMKMRGFKIDMEVYLTLTFIGYVLYPLQSTLNPILYTMVDNDWRKIMKKAWYSTCTKLGCTITREKKDSVTSSSRGSTRTVQRVYTIETTDV